MEYSYYLWNFKTELFSLDMAERETWLDKYVFCVTTLYRSIMNVGPKVYSKGTAVPLFSRTRKNWCYTLTQRLFSQYTSKSAKSHPSQKTQQLTIVEVAMMIVVAAPTPTAELSGPLNSRGNILSITDAIYYLWCKQHYRKQTIRTRL